MAGARITVAIDNYDRHGPLLQGAVTHPGFDFQFIESVQDGVGGRHEEFLNSWAWDVAELSLSTYLIAVDLGLPVAAIPVFPRRLFSQSQLYINRNSGINGPRDLPGKRVALGTYQTTLSVLAKGDLSHYYNVPWKEITYVTAGKEAVEVRLPPEVKLERGESTGQMEEDLIAGRIHAQFTPRPPKAFLEGNPNIVRLFNDPRGEEERHLKQPGYYPIMHVVAYQKKLAARHPELPRALFKVFEEARKRARHHWNDPNWSLLLWGKQEMEREACVTGRDVWANGIEANRKNIQDFTQYSHEQGLTRRVFNPEELFVDVQ